MVRQEGIISFAVLTISGEKFSTPVSILMIPENHVIKNTSI